VGQITYDLPSYKELSKTALLHSGRHLASKILVMVVALMLIFFYGVVLEDTDFLSFILFVFFGTYWVAALVMSSRNKDGDLVYKRMLSSNSGITPRMIIRFAEENMHVSNPDTGGNSVVPYNQLCSIYETEHFFVFLHVHKMYYAIKKDSITGGTAAELLDFVFAKSASIRKKKLANRAPGQVVTVLLIIFTVFCLLLSLWFSPIVQELWQRRLAINNYMDYHRIDDELESLGITDIDDSLIEELESYDWEYGYTYSGGVGSKAFCLLTWEGMGQYEEDTWEWTPSDSGVYWFDMEVISPDVMYTDFLAGVQALDPEALDFTDIVEDLSQVNYEDGCGIQRVRFSWNGKSHMLEAIVDYDWFDL
jgi:hypothetical protein